MSAKGISSGEGQVESTGKLGEDEIIGGVQQGLDKVGPPPGWYDRSPRGRKEVFDWKAMAILLMIKEHRALSYKKMAIELERDEALLKKLGLPRAPAKSTLHEASAAMPEEWFKEVGDAASERGSLK